MKNRISKILSIISIVSTNLLSQSFDVPYPFRNYNEIVKLTINENGSSFYSTEGLLQKNYKSNKWTIDATIKTQNIPTKHESLFIISPNEFESKGFDENACANINSMYAIDRIYDKYSEIYLMEVPDEFDKYHYRIVDVKNKFIHEPYYSNPINIILNGNYILTRNEIGFSRYERKKKGETLFYFLPYFNDETTCYLDSVNVWFVTNGIGIQKYNIKTQTLDYYEPQDFNNRIIESPTYTNVIGRNDEIIVGCSNHGTNPSYLLFINKESNILIKKELKYLDRIAMISGIGSDILISKHFSDFDECSRIFGAGGLYRFFTKNDSLTKYTEINDKEFVVKIIDDNTNIIIETGQYVEDNPTVNCVTNLVKRRYITKPELITLTKISETIVHDVQLPQKNKLTENDLYFYGPRYLDNKFTKMPNYLFNKKVFPQLESRELK